MHILRSKNKNLIRGNSEALDSFLQTNKKNLNLKEKALHVTNKISFSQSKRYLTLVFSSIWTK